MEQIQQKSKQKYTQEDEEDFSNSQLNDVSSYRVNPMLNQIALGAALKAGFINSERESSHKTEDSELFMKKPRKSIKRDVPYTEDSHPPDIEDNQLMFEEERQNFEVVESTEKSDESELF